MFLFPNFRLGTQCPRNFRFAWLSVPAAKQKLPGSAFPNGNLGTRPNQDPACVIVMPDERHNLHPHEAAIIDSFILGERRERYRLKLASPRERSRFLDRLNHCRDIDARFATDLDGNADAVDELRRRGAPQTCYVLSSALTIDGQTLPLDEAVARAQHAGWGTILSCIAGRIAFFYDEEGQRRMILHRTG